MKTKAELQKEVEQLDLLADDLRFELSELQKMKDQADRGVDLLIKEVKRREDVIKEKEAEIKRLNEVIRWTEKN